MNLNRAISMKRVSIDKTKGEQAEAVENLIDARQQKQIAEMLAEISERKQKLQQRLQQSHSTIS